MKVYGMVLVFSLATCAGLARAEEQMHPGTVKLAGGETASQRKALAKIDVAAAKAAAIAHAAGQVQSVKLENEDGFLIYAVKVKTQTGVLEVQIDAGSGTVLGSEGDDDDAKGDD